MLVRQHCSDYFAGQSVGHCTLLSILVQRLSEEKLVIDEFLKLIGCKDEDATVTAAKWSKFLRTMAVKMNVSDLGGKNSMGHHMTFDAVTPHIYCFHLLAHSPTTCEVYVYVRARVNFMFYMQLFPHVGVQ